VNGARDSRRWLGAVLLLAAALPGALGAQSAQIGAAAEISTTALTVGQLADLRFGDVVPGVSTVVDGRDTRAGEFQITGNRNAEVQITMTLPTELSTGYWTMPISFGATSGCWRTLAMQNNCTYWDPNTVLVERIRNQNYPNNRLFVWIGGVVSPGASQNPGMYLGDISLSVAYTGN
jgi:hypothetical protein